MGSYMLKLQRDKNKNNKQFTEIRIFNNYWYFIQILSHL